MRHEVWLRDMWSCSSPAQLVSRDRRPGAWQAVDYSLHDGPGVMLFAFPGADTSPLTIHLGAEGWYEIRLGIYYGGGAGFVFDRILCARLTDDPTSTRFSREYFRIEKDGDYPDKVVSWNNIAEVFWKCADVTGQQLVISHPSGGQMAGSETNLAYVRLVPMNDGAVAEWESEQPDEESRRLLANYDGGSFSQWGLQTREDFRAEFDCLRDGDFEVALYAVAYGALTLYPSRVGEMVPVDHRPPRSTGRYVHEAVRNGIDPLQAAIEAAHACGVKLFPQNRFIGPNLPPQHGFTDHGGKFMAEHLDWRCAEPDGQPIRHLSLAYEGVREFYVRLLREWVEDYGADGINLLFNRSWPLVYYEEPVCRSFMAEYGEDLRLLQSEEERASWGKESMDGPDLHYFYVKNEDERAQRVRASFVTRFMREIRAMLDQVGKSQGRYIPTCYIVMNSVAQCLSAAMDVAAWIREGLVDYLVVPLAQGPKYDGRRVQSQVREFARLAHGTNTKVCADVAPRRMPPWRYRETAMECYAAGADGLAFWDSYNRYSRASEWAFVKRLGHRQDLARWKGKGDDYSIVRPLKSLDGYPMDRVYSKPTDG